MTADADSAAVAPARPHMTLPMIGVLLAVTVVWGFNFAVVKAGLSVMPPIAFVALRFAVVGVMLLPWLRWPQRRFRDLVVLSVVLGVVHFSLMFTGMRGLDVATASIAIQLQVPFAAILAAIFFGETLHWRRLTGMAIAFAGVVLIAGEPRLAGNLLPLVLVIAAACTWASATIQIKRIGDDVDVLALNGWVALLAAPQLALLSWAIEDGQLAAIAAADCAAVAVGRLPGPAGHDLRLQRLVPPDAALLGEPGHAVHAVGPAVRRALGRDLLR